MGCNCRKPKRQQGQSRLVPARVRASKTVAPVKTKKTPTSTETSSGSSA